MAAQLQNVCNWPKKPDNLIFDAIKKNEIGRGSYSVVYSGKLDGRPVAVKIIHSLLLQAPQNDRLLREFEKECDILKSLQHPNIVKLLDTFRDDGDGREPLLVMEVYEENLKEYLTRNNGKLSVSRQLEIAKEVTEGLCFLHRNNIVHRDLKLENILVGKDEHVRIGDFGQSKLLGDIGEDMKSTQPGTVLYMPPEALKKGSTYKANIDVFSLGVVFNCIATQCEPTTEMVGIGHEVELKRRAKDLQAMAKHHPLELLIHVCLQDDPSIRPDVFMVHCNLNRLICSIDYPEFQKKFEENKQLLAESERRLEKIRVASEQELKKQTAEQKSQQNQMSTEKRRVEPVEPAHEDFDVIAIYDFTPSSSDNKDLPLTKGQIVHIVNSVRLHWWKARNNKGQEGYVPSNYVKKVGVETEDWFFPDLTRTRAEQILKEEGKKGGFVIRLSGNKKFKYALSICHKNNVYHYHIKQDDRDNYYISDRHKFSSVVELVNYHKSNGGGLLTRLRRPPTQLVPNQPTLSSMFDDKWKLDKRDLHLGKELGSVQFGRVVKGLWKGTVEVTIKVMECAMNEEDFIEEAQVMIKLHHPNLVQLYGICICQGPIYIVTELMMNGCLLTYIRQRKDLTSKSDVLIDMSLQICSAMIYLEASHFIHRDLAARNCGVTKMNVVKVGDFSLTRHVVDDEYTASEGTTFAIKGAAPEVISHFRFSSKSDVWSYGILMWELFSGGKTPYPSFSNPQVMEEVLKGYKLPMPSNCPKEVYTLMREAWQQYPEERPSFNVLHMKLTHLVDQDYF